MTSEASFDVSEYAPRGEHADSKWVVMKFGGSSVATLSNWQCIAQRLRQRRQDGLQVVVVHSALKGVSDLLDTLLGRASKGGGEEAIDAIESIHRLLAADFNLDADELLVAYFAELRQLIAGVRLLREVPPRVRARVMSLGELMATTLSAKWLNDNGLAVQWLDARELLLAQPQTGERRGFLNAVCTIEADPELQQQLSNIDIVLTQGFIARNAEDETVLLGRGGSDTSAAYFAAKLQARRLEIWTDVAGMFSADPRVVPAARLLKRLHYSEAQEIASTGGLVLHPRCIAPMRAHNIPMFVRCTPRPELDGTLIAEVTGEPEPQVKAISLRQNVTLLSLEGIVMWHEVGFMAKAFTILADHGISVDLVSTSESNVTVSIENDTNIITPQQLDEVVAALSSLCRVRVINDCAAVSLVGRKIRMILHKLGPALEVFEEQRIHLVSQAANDLNLTFVVDEEQGYKLIQKLHPSIIRRRNNDDTIGETWQALHGTAKPETSDAVDWWRERREALLSVMDSEQALYVYDAPSIGQAISALKNLNNVDQVFYAMKANPHVDILRQVHASGLGFECVSPGELERVLGLFADIDRKRILYTPNFAPKADYVAGFEAGAWLTLDNLFPLRAWPEVFQGREIFVRLDPGQGRGHHEHVKTAGIHSKFGVPLFELDELARLTDALDCKVVGIHAHSGSGITDAQSWREVANTLAIAATRFKDVHTLDIGGGLGVPEKPGDASLDLEAFDESLRELREAYPNYRVWLEPGRYLVARAGVLLARVTQTKGKGEMRYVGVATGMNSLIRPALYGAYHEIVNLTRLDEPASELVSVVGPICETGDKLGTDRMMPPAQEGDVLLIANAGAYGHTMGSNYNLREPAGERVLD